MSDVEVLRTSIDGRYRAVLEDDTWACEPENDGAAPFLRFGGDYYGRGDAIAMNRAAEGMDHAFNVLGDRAPSGRHQRETFERYLRIFHGTIKVQWYNAGISNEYGYVAFDTAAWREEMGCDPARLAEEDYLEEYRAWVQGDVYGVVVEERTPGACGHDGCQEHEEWVHADDTGDYQIWGLYGNNEYTRHGVIDDYLGRFFPELAAA